MRNEIKVAVKNTRDPNERNKIAKDIVAKMLNNDLVILKDGDALAEAVKTSIKDDQPPASESILQERINKAWPAVIAASKIAAAHAPEMLGALGRTAGILSYAPELASAVDRAIEAYFILPAVVERMDKTQADAERDRQRMAARLRSLIREEQTLHQQRQLARQAMAG